MRTFFSALAGFAAMIAISAGPANARVEWTCTGGELACGASPKLTSSKAKANSAKVYKASSKKVAYKKSGKRVAAKKSGKVARNYSGGGGGGSGIASYYWQPQALASGGRFNPNALTAAHKTLPFGTRVRVTNRNNGRSVVVVINDRGPYIKGRVIDLSRRAAQVVGMTGSGIAPVSYTIVGRG